MRYENSCKVFWIKENGTREFKHFRDRESAEKFIKKNLDDDKSIVGYVIYAPVSEVDCAMRENARLKSKIAEAISVLNRKDY